MPFAPDFGRSEHATRTALVSKGGLTGAVGTASRDTRNTSDSAACSYFHVSILSVTPQAKGMLFLTTASDCWRIDAPVPQDSAEVWCPAFSLTAYGWRLFFAIPE